MLKVLLACVVALTMATNAAAKERISYAYQLDPMFEAALWALKNGKIKSDTVELELSVLSIPALIQAMPTKQFDVIQSDTIAVPRSAERGLDLVIMSTAIRYRPAGEGHNLFVPADSPVRTVADLKGKKIAVPSIGSAGFHLLRFALAEKYGVDVKVPGGDFVFVETPVPTMLAALQQKRADAGTFILSQTWRASVDGGFRALAKPAKEMHALWGLQMIPSINVGYPEKIAARPQAFAEFARMLRDSVRYMRANQDEVFSAVAAEQKIDKAFFPTLFDQYAEYPGVISDQDRRAIALAWDLAKKFGVLQNAPPIDRFVWKSALSE
ncbi:MAG: PhnD/SsuA/transferrin family substrate-binding protein [Burkholderiaceae bacterium]|nr:PhnD/SsuA/transferrin family substrate-binding protein [Burkholderiaceae bacterium]